MITVKTVTGMVQEYLHEKTGGHLLLDEISIEYFDCNPDQGVVLRLEEDSEEDLIDLFRDLLDHLDGLDLNGSEVVIDTGLSEFDVAIYLKA